MTKTDLTYVSILLLLMWGISFCATKRDKILERFHYGTVKGEYIKNYVMVRLYKFE